MHVKGFFFLRPWLAVGWYLTIERPGHGIVCEHDRKRQQKHVFDCVLARFFFSFFCPRLFYPLRVSWCFMGFVQVNHGFILRCTRFFEEKNHVGPSGPVPLSDLWGLTPRRWMSLPGTQQQTHATSGDPRSVIFGVKLGDDQGNIIVFWN